MFFIMTQADRQSIEDRQSVDQGWAKSLALFLFSDFCGVMRYTYYEIQRWKGILPMKDLEVDEGRKATQAWLESIF